MPLMQDATLSNSAINKHIAYCGDSFPIASLPAKDYRGPQNPIAKHLETKDIEERDLSNCTTPVWFLAALAGIFAINLLSVKGRG